MRSKTFSKILAFSALLLLAQQGNAQAPRPMEEDPIAGIIRDHENREVGDDETQAQTGVPGQLPPDEPRIHIPSRRTNDDVPVTDAPGGKKKRCLKLDPFTGHGPDQIANFNFPDADIVEIAETLARLTCLNFIFDKEVKGRISIVNNSKVTVGDAWKAFLTALDMNGFSIIPSGKFLRIARQRDAKDKQIKTYSGEITPDTDLMITRVLPLQYISAEDTSRILRNFMPPNTRIMAYDQTNTLIITDTGANVRKIEELVEVLDVERFDERIDVIPVKHASAQDIGQLIEQLLLGGRQGAPSIPGGPQTLGRMALSGVRKTKGGGVVSHVIPDGRTNSIIVSGNEQGLAEVKGLIHRLDYKVANNPGGSRVHVIYLQYADAEQVAQTLNNLAAGSGTSSTPRPPQGTPGAPAGPVVAQLFEGAIKISADKATNSLVLTASQADFVTMREVVSKLDVPRDQVYVEAVIMDMIMDRQFELGTSVISPTSGIAFAPNTDLARFLANPLNLSGLVMGFRSGKSTTVNIPGTSETLTISSVQGLIRALQQNTNGNVIATPQLLTLDNQDAEIEISENIPVPTTTAVQGAGVATSIAREKVALLLKIKPQINKISEFVKLDIDQRLEDISSRTPPRGVADLAFSTASRSSKTTVVVQDGDTVVIGGLVRDKITDVSNKVPILGDIPILGWLFRSKTTASTKQNLLVFITPRIIRQYQTLRSILDMKIRQRDEYLERNMGGVDPFFEYKKEMIERLPPVNKLKSGVEIKNPEDDEKKAEEPKAAPG